MQAETKHPSIEIYPEFGQCYGTSAIYFLDFIDLNGSVLRVPHYQNDEYLKQLLESYQKVTSCLKKFKNRPSLLIRTGYLKDYILPADFKLSSLCLIKNQPAFQVVDISEKQFQQKSQKAIEKKNLEKGPDNFDIKINVNGKIYNIQATAVSSVKVIKAKMIQLIEELQVQAPESIKLMYDGKFLADFSLLKDYKITSNAEIKVILKQKSGCFRTNTLISTSKEEKKIQNIKQGDFICSLNLESMRVEEDEVTFIHESILDEYIVITLKNQAVLELTANHLLLCSDLQYRKRQYEQEGDQILKVGMQLRDVNGQNHQIIDITEKQLQTSETFYHLCIKNNHNFAANRFICHNMYVNLKLPGGKILKIDVDPSETIRSFKEKIERQYWTQPYAQKIIYAGKLLENENTISDYNISKEANLILNLKQLTKQSNFLQAKTPICIGKNQYKAISDLKEGDEVLTYNDETGQCEELDSIAEIITIKTKEIMRLGVNSFQNEITVIPDTYFMQKNGRAVSARDICKKHDENQSHQFKYILKSEVDEIDIRSVFQERIEPKQFFKLKLLDKQNYIAKGLIVQSLVLNVLICGSKVEQYKRIILGISSTQQISSVKRKIQRIQGIPCQNQILQYDQQILKDDDQIFNLNLKSESTIILNSKKPSQELKESIFRMSLQAKQLEKLKAPQEKTFSFQISDSEKIIINYEKYKHKIVKEIIKELVPKSRDSYFIVFSEIIVLPHEILSKIQNSEEFNLPDGTLLLNKSQKLAFIQNLHIEKGKIRNYSYILNKKEKILPTQSKIKDTIDEVMSKLFKKAEDRILSINMPEDYKIHQFYNPFLYLTSKKYTKQIDKYIIDFQNSYQDIQDQQNNFTFSLIKSLYINLNELPSYFGTVYRGLTNFRFSNYYQKNNAFYWHSFTSTCKDLKLITQGIKGQNGTIFHITSLSGKQIEMFSLFPEERQVIFVPFSYFLVNKIEKKPDFDQVWLLEMPSPITFQKNIVLWVDDIPKNNINEMKNILKRHDIEILQATSTLMAQKWVKQFGWLVNWKGLKFKLISDMVRQEEKGSNYEAGIDLLELLYKTHGITAPTLIFCGKGYINLGYQNLAKRNIRKDRIYQITCQNADLFEFCKF